MKNRRLNTSFLIALFMFSMFSFVYPQNCSLSIEVDKKEFVEGEIIYVLASLNNLSNRSMTYSMFYMESGRLNLEVIAADGKLLPYHGGRYDYSSPESLKVILPGAAVQYLCSFSHYFSNVREGSVPFPIQWRMAPGKYRIRATFQNEGQELKSNEISISIKEPENEEAVMFGKLKQTYRPEIIWGRGTENKITSFNQLSMLHPSSVYLPLIQRTLSGFYIEKGDTGVAEEILKRIIISNPNSCNAIEALKTLKLSRAEMQKFLIQLKTIDRDSRIAKFGENCLAQ